MNKRNSNSHAIPMLHEASLDYPAVEYESEVVSHGQDEETISLKVKQSICDSNLIAQLLNDKQANFAVEISSPYSIYRKIEKCEHGNDLTSEHVVTLSDEVVQTPVYLRPLIVAELKSPLPFELGEAHAVHKSWYGTKIEILRSSILARGQFWLPTSVMQSLVRIGKDEENKLSPGTYEVLDCNSDGFYFKVMMHPELFDIFLAGNEVNHCNSILTGALATGFEILRRKKEEYHPDDENGAGLPQVLNSLYKKMEQEGIEPWDSDDFKSELAASKLCPITIKKVEE